jgi:hypothetical protein
MKCVIIFLYVRNNFAITVGKCYALKAITRVNWSPLEPKMYV